MDVADGRNAAEMISDVPSWKEGYLDCPVRTGVMSSCIWSVCVVGNTCGVSVDGGSMAALFSIFAIVGELYRFLAKFLAIRTLPTDCSMLAEQKLAAARLLI
jgi:hypothetical protein